MYRTIDCATWGDPWFEELAPPGKLLFLYLISNSRTSASGAYQITLRTMANETCLAPECVTEMLDAFGTRVLWWPDHACVFVRNFYRYQRSNSSDKYRIGAAKQSLDLPDDVRESVWGIYPELRPADIPTPNPIDTPSLARVVSETVSVSATETKQSKAVTPPTPSPGVAARAAVVPNAPYRLFARFCEETGADESSVSATTKGKQLAQAKAILTEHSEDEAIACLHFLASQEWRTGLIDLGTVRSEIGKWKMSGSPPQERARASPNGSRPQTFTEIRNENNMRAIRDFDRMVGGEQHGAADIPSRDDEAGNRIRAGDGRPAIARVLRPPEETQ